MLCHACHDFFVKRWVGLEAAKSGLERKEGANRAKRAICVRKHGAVGGVVAVERRCEALKAAVKVLVQHLQRFPVHGCLQTWLELTRFHAGMNIAVQSTLRFKACIAKKATVWTNVCASLQ